MFQSSSALKVLLAPAREYRALLEAESASSWIRVAVWLASIALLMGIVTSIAAANRITLRLVASQTICWSFVPALQLLTGLLLVRFAQRRRVPTARAVELFFAGHLPWSAWLVVAAALQMTDWSTATAFLWSLPLPAIATARILAAFCREVLGLSKRSARVGVLAHQAVTWVLILAYVEVVGQLAVRVSGGDGS